jgi:cation:H+ antiporter
MLGFSLGLAGGLGLLIVGGKAFVDGAAALARTFRVRPLVIGIVIIGFGTSTPELLVSLFALGDNKGGIAVGNIVGSNIANIGLIMALAAVIFPLVVTNQLLRKELPLTVGLTVLFGLVIIVGGELNWVDGVVLLAGFILTLLYILAGSRPKLDQAAQVLVEQSEEEEIVKLTNHRPGLALCQTLGGLVVVLIGAEITVDNASNLARGLGVSEAIIGLTVVAFGTSLPELVAAVMAAIKGETELIIGNVLGSNLYNLGFTGGVIALFSGEGLALDNSIRFYSTGFMVGLTLLLVPLLLRGLRLSRLEGGFSLGLYSLYLFWLF